MVILVSMSASKTKTRKCNSMFILLIIVLLSLIKQKKKHFALIEFLGNSCCFSIVFKPVFLLSASLYVYANSVWNL